MSAHRAVYLRNAKVKVKGLQFASGEVTMGDDNLPAVSLIFNKGRKDNPVHRVIVVYGNVDDTETAVIYSKPPQSTTS